MLTLIIGLLGRLCDVTTLINLDCIQSSIIDHSVSCLNVNVTSLKLVYAHCTLVFNEMLDIESYKYVLYVYKFVRYVYKYVRYVFKYVRYVYKYVHYVLKHVHLLYSMFTSIYGMFTRL